jgi:uncharacterized protein (TIGR02996 family)
MSSDVGAELLARVIAAPDDDAPRLAYARWLTDQGDPRGEYITVQCQLAGDRPNPQRRKELEARARELGKALRKTIAAEVKPAADQWEIRRGFVDEVRTDAATLLEHHETLFGRAPIRRVTLWGVEAGHVEELVASGILGRLVNLSLHGEPGEEGARALAGAPALAAIRKLNLARCDLGDEGVAALVASPHLACTQLTLRENAITDDGAQALADAPALAGCRALFLARNALGDDGVRALAGSPYLANLEQLGLGGNEDIGEEGFQALLAPGIFPRMRRLELERLEPDDVDALRERWGTHVRF